MKILLTCSILIVLVCGGVFAQSWDSASSTGMTAVDFIKSGNDYTITLYNMTGIAGDPTVGYDVIIWSLEPFNLPAPQNIIEMPSGWVWQDGGFSMFEIGSDSQKYYSPPALAPGSAYTFRFISDLLTPVNPGGPADGSPGFLCHVAAVDSSAPGSEEQKWIPYTAENGLQTWLDRSVPVPEPGGLLALATGLFGFLGLSVHKRR